MPCQQGGWQTFRIQGRTRCLLAYVLMATSCRWTCCFTCNVAPDSCFSVQHGLLITSVMRTTLAMLGPLQHLSLPECACSPSPALFISSPCSSGKGDATKHFEKLSSICRVSMGDGVGESRGSWVWAIQQGLWEGWVPTC